MVYLDHNATSPLRASARLAVEAVLDNCGNASSVHAAGRAARARIEEARDRVAGLAGATPASVVFTSGGSEANALALRGAIAGAAQQEDRVARLFASAIEHESVRATASALAEAVPGLKLTEIPVTKDGTVDLHALRLHLIQGKGRVLVSVMVANNETGVVQDIPGIAKLIKSEGGKGALVHVDAVQAAGRTALTFLRVGRRLHDALQQKSAVPGRGDIAGARWRTACRPDRRRWAGDAPPLGYRECRGNCRCFWRGSRRTCRFCRWHGGHAGVAATVLKRSLRISRPN